MKRFATVSYNMHCNFTNYGSALQTYALQRAINEIAPSEVEAIVLDYCPDVLRDKDVLNPFAGMWDPDPESKHMVELTMPAIRVNYEKFERFYRHVCPISKGSYTSENFNDSLEAEHLDGYVCGSDTIFCIREFGGFDDGYYANYPVMQESRSVSYAASFGDVDWTKEELRTLISKLSNFKSIGIREPDMLGFIREHLDVPAQRVLDPTLLFSGSDYECITAAPQYDEPYRLLYSRRYNPAMEQYAEGVARQLDCRVVEISLRAVNEDKGHIMRYDAGVEEYLSLVKHARYMVTNSYHGLIFAAQMHTPFTIFSREQADRKIDALLEWIGLSDRKLVSSDESIELDMSFEDMEERLVTLRADSLAYLSRVIRA